MFFTLTIEETLADWFYQLCKLVSSILAWLIGLLPDSGLNVAEAVPDSVRQYIGWVNWFLPIREMVLLLGAWVSALLIFFIVSIVMKWIKIVGGE